MLPENLEGRTDYLRYRTQRTLHRELVLESRGEDGLKTQELSVLAMEAEMTGLREQMDFLISEGMLKPEQIEALQNAIAWGEAFLKTLNGEAA